MGIKWGDVNFEGPYPITAWEPPYRAALYAIMMSWSVLRSRPKENSVISIPVGSIWQSAK